MNLFSFLIVFFLDCPDQCSGKGRCVNSTCQCMIGWSGDSCELGRCSCLIIGLNERTEIKCQNTNLALKKHFEATAPKIIIAQFLKKNVE